jgi:hypothetical protein
VRLLLTELYCSRAQVEKFDMARYKRAIRRSVTCSNRPDRMYLRPLPPAMHSNTSVGAAGPRRKLLHN